jgi:hypothetical protein
MHDAATTRASLQVGAAVRVVPGRVLAEAWTGQVVELDARGYPDPHERVRELGVLVLPTMPGKGWSTVPVWLPYERVQPMAEA